MTIGELEAQLAQYLSVLRAVTDSALPDSPQLREACVLVGHFLHIHLASHPDWRTGDWIDGVLPWTITWPSEYEFELMGEAVLGSHRNTNQFLEPLLVRLRFAPRDGSLSAFCVQFGNLDGLKRIDYGGTRTKQDRFLAPNRWMFTIEEERGTE